MVCRSWLAGKWVDVVVWRRVQSLSMELTKYERGSTILCEAKRDANLGKSAIYLGSKCERRGAVRQERESKQAGTRRSEWPKAGRWQARRARANLVRSVCCVVSTIIQ